MKGIRFKTMRDKKRSSPISATIRGKPNSKLYTPKIQISSQRQVTGIHCSKQSLIFPHCIQSVLSCGVKSKGAESWHSSNPAQWEFQTLLHVSLEQDPPLNYCICNTLFVMELFHTNDSKQLMVLWKKKKQMVYWFFSLRSRAIGKI